MPAGGADMSTFDAIIALPFGPFGIRARDGQVRELVFLPPGTPLHDPRNATAGAAAHALRAWIEAEPTEGPTVAQMREDDLL